MKRALISVSDKTGVVDLAKRLLNCGFEIVSTGGTSKELTNAGLKVTDIAEVTSFPECLDGRVKTLHPNIFSGILAMRSNNEHMNQINQYNIGLIDVVVVNLYPFKQTILQNNVTLTEAIENIDIGGPSMLRAAAKNYQDVAVITDVEDYNKVIDEIESNGKTSVETNFYLCAKLFAHTATYDALIAEYLREQAGLTTFGPSLTLTYEKVQDMRYGENPHQQAAFYKEIRSTEGQLTNLVQLHGLELSFNNINDAHGALELVKEFDQPTVVASKHSNPCGVGSGENIYEAWMKAYNADPVSVFGGVIVCNTKVDFKTAAEMNKIKLDIIIAPAYTKDALKKLQQKPYGKNLRILTLENMNIKQPLNSLDIKKVSGGLLVQTVDNTMLSHNKDDFRVVTKKQPTDKELEDLLFAWKLVKHTKSNGIAIGKDKQSIGIGPGQVNRIWATKQAIEHGHEALGKNSTQGACLASDAFFPFDDCVETAAAAGITAIIQPGGSINDQLSIDACNKHGIAMVFTGMRHFRH